jgi:hypothetical protein
MAPGRKRVRVQIHLLEADVTVLKSAAARVGDNWQDRVRALIHSGVTGDAPHDLYAWKFIVPSHTPVPLPDDSTVRFKGCLGVAVAPTENAAREIVRNAARAMGWDARWLVQGCATVVRLDVTSPGLICYSMVE